MPIVVGAPRSGTTLLRFMLDAHPALAIPPETGFLYHAQRLASGPAATREAIFSLLTEFPENAPAWPDFGLDRDVFRTALAKLEPFSIADGVRAFYRLYAEKHGKSRWGDKTPLHTPHLGEIEALLPEARFVHLLRDGRDVALSLRRTWFAPAQDMTSLAEAWVRFVTAGRREGAERRHYLEVRYEALVNDAETELRRICAFLSLDFDAAMLRYHQRTAERLREHGDRFDRQGRLLVSHAERLTNQARTTRPPLPERCARWRDEMTSAELAEFGAHAGPLLAELGYA